MKKELMILGIISLVLFVNACVSIPEGSVQMKFYINETGEPLNGELFVNDVSLGNVVDGIILVNKSDFSNVSEFTFKADYNGKKYPYDYPLRTDYEDYSKLYYIVLQSQFGEEYTEKDSIDLIFIHETTNCTLNGDVYLNNNLLGKTTSGHFFWKKSDYKARFKSGSNISIKGTTDSCFKADSGLPFYTLWNPESIDYDKFTFTSEVNIRSPNYPEAMQGFVRPSEASDFIKQITFTSSTLDNVKKISNYMSSINSYMLDSDLFKANDYWQTPAEYFKRHMGDCEDWTSAFLSSLLAYKSDLKCYNILLSTHLTNFCYLGDYQYSFMDQSRVEIFTKLAGDGYMQDELYKLRKLRNDYFDNYGISPSENAMYYAYNDKEIVRFKNNEDFITWAMKFSYPAYS